MDYNLWYSIFRLSPKAFFTPSPLKGTYEHRRKLPPLREVISAEMSIPASHFMSTIKPPRAQIHFTEPLFPSSGMAGKE